MGIYDNLKKFKISESLKVLNRYLKKYENNFRVRSKINLLIAIKMKTIRNPNDFVDNYQPAKSTICRWLYEYKKFGFLVYIEEIPLPKNKPKRK